MIDLLIDNYLDNKFVNMYSKVDALNMEIRRRSGEAVILLNDLNVPESREYLNFGLMRRLGMVAYSLKELNELNTDNGVNSSWDVFERKADVHINSLYINIWGALDNIAWVFAYESNYIGEAGTKNYGEITFEQNKGLFKHLEKERPQFLEKIKTINFFKWLSELSKIRHPSAHRIKLRPVV